MSTEKYTFKDRETVKHAYDQHVALRKLAISDTLSSLCVVGKTDLGNIKDNIREVNNIGSSITALDDYCFYSCTNLGGVNSNAVSALGDHCFDGCTSLSSFTGFSGSSTKFYSIGDYCFQGTGLKDVKLDLVGLDYADLSDYNDCKPVEKDRGPYIGLGAFKDCTQLSSITFKTSTEISENEFEGCTSLVNVNFESNHGSCVGEKCFKDCTSLQSITFPSQFQSFSNYMFQGCTALTSVNWDESDGVSQMLGFGDYCFAGCSGLSYLEFPSCFTDIFFMSDNTLAESSITRVKFRGINSTQMRKYVNLRQTAGYSSDIITAPTTDFKYGTWYGGQNCIKVFDFAKEYSIPVFILETRQSGCGLCTIFHKNVMSSKAFQDWMAEVPMLFVYGAESGTIINRDVQRVRQDIEGGGPYFPRNLWKYYPKLVYTLPCCEIVRWTKNAKTNRDIIAAVSTSDKSYAGIKEIWEKFFASDYVEDADLGRSIVTPTDEKPFTFGGIGRNLQILTSDNVKYMWKPSSGTITTGDW